jgi:rRNA maturation RNase YbeY
MRISYFLQDRPVPKFLKKKISAWIKQTIVLEEKFPGDISFVFCSDEHLLKVNRDYLKHDYFTDVITFDYSENAVISGDILISVDRVAENAKEFQHDFIHELFRVMIHGVLHLLGYTDQSKSDKNTMTEMENTCLNRLLNN